VIPRHAPPFALDGLLSVICRGSDVDQSALEKACAKGFRVREAILLPSARTGILLRLRAVGPSVESVVGPAFTCSVVHQAMELSGLPIRFIDSEPCGYLMNADDLRKAAEGPSAVVLCEIYGLRYSAHGAALGGNRPPITRIWDMAMCVPQPDDFRRLETNDVAVVSFGLGKCLYAGWGGLLLTQDAELAARIRGLRDQLVIRETPAIRARRGLEVFVRAVAYNRFLYGFGRTLADWRNGHALGSHTLESAAAPGAQVQTQLSREWIEPMTALNRKLAMANLAYAAEKWELRRRQAIEYCRCLEPLGVIRGFDRESLPESHFPIRVAGKARNGLRRFLACRGIDTGTYFSFPRGLPRATYPAAAQASDEVILLPLGPCIREDEVQMVAKHVMEGLRRIAN